MNSKRICVTLFFTLVVSAQAPLHAQSAPPGGAATLSTTQAKAMLEDAIKKRFAGTLKTRYSFAVSPTYVLTAAVDVDVRITGFSFSAPYNGDPSTGHIAVNFRKKGLKEVDKHCEIGPEGYLGVYRPDLSKTSRIEGQRVSGHDKVVSPTPFYSVAYLPDPDHAFELFQCESAGDLAIFAWTDETAAREFADAFNRLLYAALRNEMEPEFIAAAKAWRENPNKPPLNAEADEHWVLAENAVKERNLDEAVQNYEAALEIQPMWPTGWYDLAMIYGEQKQYADAAGAMRRYLELVPEASDAKAARDQLIIWDNKAKQEAQQK